MYLRFPQIKLYPHQKRIFEAVRNNKHVLAIIHRRSGKDVCCVNLWVYRALIRVGTHVYLFPQTNQSRAVIWNGMDFDGNPFLNNIPSCLIKKKNEARMEIELINGSRLLLCGSNNYDSLMGSNPVTIIYSEYALHHPLARQYLNPILVQNNGLEIIQSTPRGKNHLFDVYDIVRDNPKYHVEYLNIKETFKCDGSPIITESQIADARNMGMSEEMFQQEFLVSFEVGNLGAYFTREMAEMDKEGRITNLVCNPNQPLHTAWDLGSSDATACWLFQLDGNYINLLHIIHDNSQPLKWYLEKADLIRQSLKCKWGNHFAPHDILQKHQGYEHCESRIIQARRAGWNFQVTPKVNFDDGIESMRYIFPKLRIDKNNCKIGVTAIREYQRLYDDIKGCYATKPLDNWATHIADALRYLALNYRRLYDIPQPPSTYKTNL